jgi:hypothetical protein
LHSGKLINAATATIGTVIRIALRLMIHFPSSFTTIINSKWRIQGEGDS